VEGGEVGGGGSPTRSAWQSYRDGCFYVSEVRFKHSTIKFGLRVQLRFRITQNYLCLQTLQSAGVPVIKTEGLVLGFSALGTHPPPSPWSAAHIPYATATIENTRKKEGAVQNGSTRVIWLRSSGR
jgi:hypothetical protein